MIQTARVSRFAFLLGAISFAAALPVAGQGESEAGRTETRARSDAWWKTDEDASAEAPAGESATDDSTPATAATVPVNNSEPSPAPVGRSTQLDDIVVTSQKRVQSIQDVPISVTALTSQMLFEQGVTDVREALQLAPNASIDSAGFFSAPRVRGFTLNNNNKAFEPPVGMAFDGIPHARIEYFQAALMDTARIEVLRGPQGTSFGKNTTAGLIQIISKEPTSSPEGSLQIERGELGRQHIEAAYSGPLTNGLNFRIAGLLDERDGYVDNTTGAIVDAAPEAFKDRKRTGVRFTLEAPDVLDSRFLLSFESSRMFDGGTAFEMMQTGPAWRAAVRNYDANADFTPGNWVASADNPDYKDVTIRRGRFQVERPIGNWDFVVLGSHAVMSQELRIDTDFTPAPAIPGWGADLSPESYAEIRFTAPTLDGLAGLSVLPGSSELLFGVSGGRREILNSNFRFGINNRPFWELTGAAGTDTGAPPDPNASAGGIVGAPAMDSDKYDEMDQRFTQGSDELSGFAHLRYDIHPQWSAELGGRYTTEKKNGFWDMVFTTPEPNTTLRAIGAEPFTATRTLEMQNFQPKVSLGWKPISDISMFLHWEKGFKGGGFNAFAFREGVCESGINNDPNDSDCQAPTDNPTGPTFAADDLVFGDEVATNIGLDIKTWLFDRTMNLNVSLFREVAKNFQVLIRENPNGTVGLGTSIVVNAEEALAQGVEADLRWLPLDWLNIMASVGVLQTEFVKFTRGECPAGNSNKDLDGDGNPACAQTGKPFPFAPELGVTTSVRVTLPMSNLPLIGPSMGGLSFVAGTLAEYESTQLLDVDLEEKKRQAAYTRYRADVGITSLPGRWTLRLVGENLTNTVTWVRLGDVFEDVVVGSQNQPRLFYLQFRQDF